MNPMKDIRIEKLTLNCGVGEAGDKLDKAMRLLEQITGKKPVKTTTMRRKLLARHQNFHKRKEK